MASRVPASERALRLLQDLVRRSPGSDERSVRSRRIPPDLADDENRMLYLFEDEEAAFGEAQAVVVEDLRFEHLDRDVDEAVWRFVCECVLDRKADRVGAFVEAHAREPEERMCFFPVESLKVAAPIRVLGLSLLPTDDPQIPPTRMGFGVDRPVGSVAVEQTLGTHLGRMAERARAAAQHKLRLLRVALRESRGIHDRQLRFRLTHSYSFGGGLVGWRAPPEQAWELNLDGELAQLADSQAVAVISATPTTDLERRTNLALEWIDSSFFATRQVVALLYLFFALEALLGDKAEGLKAHGLAFRRALLGVATDGSFTDPGRVYLLYEKVRSAAVHGEDVPAVDPGTFQGFAWDVRQALRQYIEFAHARKLQRRSRVLKALEEHPEKSKLIEWLREHGDPSWQGFLDRAKG